MLAPPRRPDAGIPFGLGRIGLRRAAPTPVVGTSRVVRPDETHRPVSSARGRRWCAAVALFATLVLAAACASPAWRDDGDLDERVERYLEARRQRLAAARADFAQREPFPRRVANEYGTVILERAELVGPMDEEFLRVRVCYVNTSAMTYDRVFLTFSIVDGFGRVQARRQVEFVMPLDYRFNPGSSYSDEVHVPTDGGHAATGWDVTVEMHAETW